MKISKMAAPSKGISSTFIAGDWHSNHLSTSTFNILIDHAKSLPPDMRNIIINGDFLDAGHLMARDPEFKKWMKRGEGIEEYFLAKSEAEFEWGNECLDRLQEVFKDIIFIEGNHDWRYRWFAEKMAPPAYKHNFDYMSKLHFNKRGIDHVYYNEWLDWGDKLSITHGMYHGTTCHKKHYEASGSKNVVFSHIHSYDCKSFVVRGDTRNSVSLPAICDLNPEYIRGRETNWSKGYGQILMRPDSSFNLYVHQAWNGKIILPCGQSFEG
jgi:3',5'-cyclic AMP phosphodiesterase CpdA